MRYAFCCLVAVFVTALRITSCDADVLTCFGRGAFDINAALDDIANKVELKGLSDVYAPHGALVNKADEQYAVDDHGLPYNGFSVDLDTSQYVDGAGAEHYSAVISKHEGDISIFVARVERGDFDPQNASITITLPSMEYVEIDRFLSDAEMKAHGYTVPHDDEPVPGSSAINVIWFGNCRQSQP